ncbi:hypothetical protein CRI94_12555 [Longibacter salinarum]|uniref:Soluble ligand binding domain-containing protein n=1 Tax=Longibacter salinarum TaxID=1850348 RepID=A0A2A8CVP9_9BACT|nr:hypothetical protein [Longibacter salinarum]PEN12829.1 hypothetical protein CRI94_12555 [Longibacter salinarum]
MSNSELRRLASFLTVIVFITGVPLSTYAQGVAGSGSTPTDANIQTYARPGEATMIVNVWGEANRPGIWRVERDVDLVEFLSVVQVPGIGLDQIGQRSTPYVVIYRSVGGERKQIYREKIEDILEEGSSYPDLQNNDILAIEVKRRRTIGLRMISTLIGTASSLTLLVLRLSR